MTCHYSLTDPQDHRMQFRATGSLRAPHVRCQAENLARGGATASVCLPAREALELANLLDQQAPGRFTDAAGDVLEVNPGDTWTRFTFKEIQEDDRVGTVPVVVLTARLPQVADGLRLVAACSQGGPAAVGAEGRTPSCSGAAGAVTQDGTCVCQVTPAQEPAAPLPRSDGRPLQDAAQRFAARFSYEDTARDVAPALQCVEAEALIGLLRATGAPAKTLALWLDAHTDSASECQGHSPITG